MPGLDGLALLQRIKFLHPMTPVVLITGRIEPDLQDYAFRLVAYAFMTKPFIPDAFLAAVNDAALAARSTRKYKNTARMNEADTEETGRPYKRIVKLSENPDGLRVGFYTEVDGA